MIEIIPATDIIGGQCVRLTQGDYASRKTYYRDPLEAAFRFEEAGIRRLHMVDLDGAKASEPRNLAVLERIAARTSLEVQYGGGIKSREALHSVFDAGARRAICGSVAVRRPDLFAAWLAEFDPGRLILGADVRNGAVAIEGWLESSTLSAPELIGRFIPQGLTQVICTDISRDGMGIGGGNVKAGVCVAKSEREALQNFKAGDILVIDSTTNELLDVMKKASGIITAQPGVNSHAAIVGLALNIPVIVGAKDCTQILRNGTSILLDASKGIVCNLTNQQD